MLRASTQVIFYKSTILKSKISNATISGSRDFWGEWHEWIKKRGIIFKEKKPAQISSKLKHGIEKSNKIFEKKNEAADVSKQEQIKTMKEKAFAYLDSKKAIVWDFRIEIFLGIIMLQLLFIQISLFSSN